jgi:hypothetical protein
VGSTNSHLGHSEAKIGPFPKIKSWKIHGQHESIQMIDLAQTERFEFHNTGSIDALQLAWIPTQLTELCLKQVTLDHRSFSRDGAHFMPTLATLRLSDSSINGLLRQYLAFPNLKNLYLQNITILGGPEQSWSLANGFSFEEVPNLEHFSLEHMETDSSLCSNLQQCPSLRELRISSCFIGNFVPPFIKTLTSGTSFSSLMNIVIDSSWPDDLGFSFRVFARICARYRPRMGVYGNSMPYGL